jgi:diguanylate cyclase (GGDEF)-like protein
MAALDPWTLWMANTAILLFAAGVWAVLGGFYRIAPGAAAFFFASQWLALPALPCHGCGPPWPGAWLPIWVQALCGLLALGLLAAGVRRLLKLPARRWLAGLILALGAAALLSGVLGQETLSLRMALLGMALAGALSGLMLWRGTAGAAEHGPWQAALCLPFLAISLLTLLMALFQPVYHVPGVATQLLPVALHVWIPLSLMALAVRRLWLRIAHLARHDSLTGALNRRALDELLARARARLRRGQGFAWIVLDVDHFKQINDELGHAGGDAALRHITRLLMEECREPDAVLRLGGEEFGLLLPGCDLAGATTLATRLRQRLMERPLQWEGRSLALQASFGVCQAQPALDAGDDSEALLQRSDALLYQAKALGRNRVITELGEAPA